MNKQTSYERLALLAVFSSIFYFNAKRDNPFKC